MYNNPDTLKLRQTRALIKLINAAKENIISLSLDEKLPYQTKQDRIDMCQTAIREALIRLVEIVEEDVNNRLAS